MSDVITDTPTPFKLPATLPYEPEEEDRLLPQEGFITDFIAATRGVETPTLFCLWSALWALSTSTCRTVYMPWISDSPLFPNLYVFLVAPPGRCHKSTAALIAQKMLMKLKDEFVEETAIDKYLAIMTSFNWITSKTTPDALYEALMPPPKLTLKAGAQKLEVDKGSQISCCISELESFLNKRKYMEGIVGTLTDLYDCKDLDIIRTLKRGNQEVREVYITFIGAITPTGLRDSLPDESRGEGFVSRVVIVFKERTERRFSMPQHFEGFPTIPDLRKKLAWLLRNKQGDFRLTPDAREWYEKWYDRYRDRMDSDSTEVDRNVEARFDVNLLRLATLMSFSRYTTSRDITIEDLKDADRILRGTFPAMSELTQDLAPKNAFSQEYTKIRNYLQKKGLCDKTSLVKRMSVDGISVIRVMEQLKQLIAEGRIHVVDATGAFVGIELKWEKDEHYKWVELVKEETK